MATHGQGFTVDDVLDHLDENFDIPDDGIDSEIELDDEVEDEEELIADFADQGENIRLSEFEIVEMDDSEPAKKRGRKSVSANFDELQWSKIANTFTGNEFDQPTGPSTVMSAEKGDVDFFLLLINNHMLSQIVTETNRYARQSLQGQGKDPSEWNDKEVTLAEMKAWLGLVMAMSIHKVPAIVDYWKDDWILGVQYCSEIT